MNSSQKLSIAIAAVLGGGAAGLVQAAPAADTEASGSLEEITVTAQRRTENIQNVPIAIQALTADTLEKLSVSTFDDYVRYLPNVTVASNGPGQNNIFMRGLSVGAAGSQSSGTIGGFPNVAIYLDEQSGQLPSRNLDVYAADLERIEVLEGPQGTLFGAGAQAGVVRYITNKPKIDVTEGSVEAGYGITAGGDPNTDLTAVINLPLIAQHLAFRAVVYNDRRGGYIDNVPATFTRKDTDIGIHYANYPDPVTGLPAVPPNAPVINNNSIAASNINPVTYTGTRMELLYQINDDWNALVTQTYQNMDSQGVFYQMPNASDGQKLNPLEVTLFNNAYNKDKFTNTAWTLNGKIFDDLRLVYTGGYLVRHVDQVADYTNYARGVFADYYQCYGPGTGYAVPNPNPPGYGDPNLTSTCFSPSSTWREQERNEHLSNEIRLSTPDDWRARGIIGAFFETNKLFDQTDWSYKTIPNCTSNNPPGGLGNTGCMSNVGVAPGATVENSSVRGDNTAFFEDTQREVKQTAFFGSADFDIIPKVLTITAGTRHYTFDNKMTGSVTSSFYCFEQGAPAGGCINDVTNLNKKGLSFTESGFKSRANITWHATPDIMFYATWSQGFRPGGFNRQGGPPAYIPGPDGKPQFAIPNEYHSDDLTNKEIGWKAEFLNHRLQWNGAVYQENWDNVQIGFFDPGETGNLAFGTNGQNFRIRGIETSIVARVGEGLTLQGAAAWNSSEQTNSPALIDTNPDSVNYGKPITQNCPKGVCSEINNLFGPPGSPSANSPPIQFNLRARYDWTVNGYAPFVQVGAQHVGHSYTQAGNDPTIADVGVSTTLLRFENPAYTTYDASMGVAKDAWSAHIYAQNMTNTQTSLFTNTAQFVVAETALRPRVLGFKFYYKF
jgi:outer membrane receptor protein involved in Fe transport